MLALVVPHIYLCQAEPAHTLTAIRRGGTAVRPIPPADRRNMDYFSRRFCQVDSLQETFQGMFQVVHENRDKMVETLGDVASALLASLESHRLLEPYQRKAKSARPGDGRSRQFIISGELLREPVLDPKAPITRNEVLDLIHAVDAVDYCDLVLLDKAWERRVNALRQRISDAEVDMPIARCFSKRNNGIEKFLIALECWPESSPAP